MTAITRGGSISYHPYLRRDTVELRDRDTIDREFSRIGKAVAGPRRLALLELLAQGPRTVARLADHAGMSVANTSHQPRQARLVRSERDGQFITYSLAGEDVRRFVASLLDWLRLTATQHLATLAGGRRGHHLALGCGMLVQQSPCCRTFS